MSSLLERSHRAKIFGRDDEVEELLWLLGVPASNTRGPPRPKRKRSAIYSSANEATITTVPVLPMVGIGGVGKTILAQTICSNPKVQKHFDVIVWICVSDDFDVKRLTKEAIEKISGNTPTMDNLSSLQYYLIESINDTRFLFVLDDVWVEDAELWKRFYAPFKHVLEGSMMLVTTRSQRVADIVRTTDSFSLEGLLDGELQKFFKQCVFGSDSSSINPELERIGEQILPKLKGSPLAAKTIGRLLGMSLDPEHWNMILNSQLWELTQEGTYILPALRLSYMYLPFHLKRCFSFCAVYPKDYNFVKEDLAEIWVAEGFVEPRCKIPLQQTGCEYFEELAHLSFFQKLRGKYVMHDLIHDMAQLVSNGDCFIIKEKRDIERIPHKERQDGAGLLAMQSAGSSTSSLPPLPAAGPPSILEELLGPAVQADVLREIFVSMTEILAVGGFLGALGFAVHVLRPRVALAQLLGLTVTAPALGTPMIPNQDRSRRRRRSRWEPSLCYLCNSNEVSYFFSCCQDLVCYNCASGRGPAMCRCNSMRRPVPHRPQYWPLPERRVHLLRHPIWQIYSISDEPNFIVIRYFRPEDAYYSQAITGIRYIFHFFMEGARWTRCILACYTATPHVQLPRIHVIEYSNPEGNNEAESV